MSDTEAERGFHLEAMKEAIGRMQPELEAASEAAHKMKEHDDSHLSTSPTIAASPRGGTRCLGS